MQCVSLGFRHSNRGVEGGQRTRKVIKNQSWSSKQHPTSIDEPQPSFSRAEEHNAASFEILNGILWSSLFLNRWIVFHTAAPWIFLQDVIADFCWLESWEPQWKSPMSSFVYWVTSNDDLSGPDCSYNTSFCVAIIFSVCELVCQEQFQHVIYCIKRFPC